jgi:hypothetical protein
MPEHAICTSGSHDDPIDGLHAWSDHAPECEQGGGPLTCGLAAFEAEEHEERLVADYRHALRMDRLRAESDRGDGEQTPACLGCLNGCGYCERDD